ncbi:MAG: rhodanese-like domain-containing protein [Cyanobacteria bacterium P01_E01_bin.6]
MQYHANRLPNILRPWWRSLSVVLAVSVLVGLLWLPQRAETSHSQAIDHIISSAELLKLLDDESQPLILDVRTAEEYAAGHIPGAVNIHFRELPDQLDELRLQNPSSIVVYCEVGVRAGIAEQTLEEAGFESIFHLDGDMRAWRSQNLPVIVSD